MTHAKLSFSYPDAHSLRYSEQQPFPHLVLKNAWDAQALNECLCEIRQFEGWDGGKDTEVSRRKRTCSNDEQLPPSVLRLIDEASSPRFLRWLQELTGDRILLPDPYLEGGGLHQILGGGHLKVHTDFNWNRKIQLYRRANLLLYLNPDWDEQWGGELELWAPDLKRCAKRVLPDFNTMVIFTTDDQSYHGHPEPLRCPDGIQRNSIALYYYSPIKPTANFDGERTATNWRPTGDDTFYDHHATLAQRVGRKVKSLLR